MRAVHRSVFRPVLAAVLALVASPVLAQAPEEPSTRAGVIEKARDTLVTESVTPQRSVIERGLSWYDNQYLFAKLLGGWRASTWQEATSRQPKVPAGPRHVASVCRRLEHP
jgi:hypothetical protein